MLAGQSGQSTVEAAVLLPTLMLLLALLVQPICQLYTSMVMCYAAAGAARVMVTSTDAQVARSFALRRLEAVPEVSPFHVGGKDDWEVSAVRLDEGRRVQVTIRGHARPLPLLGAVGGLVGECDAKGVVLHSRVTMDVRPAWLEGDYGTWQTMW